MPFLVTTTSRTGTPRTRAVVTLREIPQQDWRFTFEDLTGLSERDGGRVQLPDVTADVRPVSDIELLRLLGDDLDQAIIEGTGPADTRRLVDAYNDRDDQR